MSRPDLCLVGAGYWGKNLARNFHSLECLHTICDSNLEMLDSYESLYPSVARTNDYREVLASNEITKVAIAAPAHLHFTLAREAIEAGKDVYVEKPLCLELSQAEKLIALAESRGKILMVGHLLQYHGYVEKLFSLVRSGELGRLLYITSNRLNLGKIRREENSLWSFAPHDISVILAIAGVMPDEVRCSGGSFLTPGVADTTLTQLKFPGELQCHIYVSWLNPFKEQKLTVVGSKGMLVFDDTKPWEEKLVLHKDYLTWSPGNVPEPLKKTGEAIVIEQSEPLRSECAHFLNCCETRTTPRTDGAEGLRVLNVLHAAQHSLENEGVAVSPNASNADVDYWKHETAEVDRGAEIGEGTKIWHYSHVCATAKIGVESNLGQNVFVAAGVEIGSNVKIQNNVSVYAGTIIEDDVFLGPSCVLTNVSNPRSQVVRRGIYESTIIRRGATIGANATIVCGVEIGRYAFVSAGAVLTSDVPDYGFMRGVPARQVGWMSRHGHPLNFDASGSAVCPESKLRYKLSSDGRSVSCTDLDENAALPEPLAVGSKAYRDHEH